MSLQDLINKQEELHKDLVPYVENSIGFTCLKHPLVFGIPYSKEMNAIYNEQYKHKKEAIDKAFKSKNWGSYLFLHERPYRLSQFLNIIDQLSNKDYGKYFAEIWIDSENLWQFNFILEQLINHPGSKFMMDDEDKKLYKLLPKEFVIHRGHQGKNKKGYSWTLSYWQAKRFSDRFQYKNKYISSALVKKEDICTVLKGRGELEIVVPPNKVKFLRQQTIKRSEWMNKILNDINLFKKSYHGIWHWEKVEKNALTLAKNNKADKTVVQLFALIHDSQRLNENEDPGHGQRAADFAKELFNQNKLNISVNQLEKLMIACQDHEKGFISDDVTIGTCWDADRLDLTRVGIIPQKKYLSTQIAKDLLWKI